MSYRKTYKYIIAGCLIFTVGLILVGCSAGKSTKSETAAASSEAEMGSAQLWAVTCSQCHNLRSPSSYSDVQWEVAMHHMRVRADLTPTQQRRILEYLQASN